MVKSLVIENSTDLGTVALAEGVKVLALREIIKRGMLSGTIRNLVLEFGRPEEVVVGLGPGSYAGTRVAVATVVGLRVGLGCQAFGCPSVLAYNEATYYVVGDAKRGSVFLASIEQNRLVRVPELLSMGQFRLILPGLRSRPVYAIGQIPGVVDLPIVRPRAEYLLLRRDSFRLSLEPLYLKEPHITHPNPSIA